MKYFTLFIFFLFVQLTNAQPNLVSNPSFEDYKNCPTETTLLDSNLNAFQWFGLGGYSGPTYLNSCSNPYSNSLPFPFGFGVPQNGSSYQFAKSGNAHAAFHVATFHYYDNIGFENDYMGNRLKEKCINRLKYKGSFFCAACDKMNLGHHRSLTISNMGMLFCSSIPKLKNNNYIELTAQINNDSTKILSDTINWMEVSGIFEANGTEQYVLIGTFNPYANTKFYNTYGHPEPWLNKEMEEAAYFIDDVSLIPQNTTHYYDSILCSNVPLQLGAVAQADSFEWHDGNKTDKLRQFTQPGLVWVKSWLYGGTVYMWDSINLINQPISTGLPKDTFFCFNQPNLTLTATANDSYLWQDGSLVNGLLVNEVDLLNGNIKVWLTVTKNTCTLTDTVTITQKPAIQIPITDTTTCFEDVPQILLDAGAQFKTYLWQPTGETTKTVYSQQAQIYNLIVTDSFNCTQTKSIIVDELCKTEVFIPNAFTPNNDNLNDSFKPIFKTKNLLKYEFKIFDSWGTEVFTTTDPTKAWDAKNIGIGVFVVLVNYQYKGFFPQTQKGTVTLLR
ncbi:MAG: gliding motility-associated C-terminal domain-containing protein [Candidatus Methylacidiphilales bacterium]